MAEGSRGKTGLFCFGVLEGVFLAEFLSFKNIYIYIYIDRFKGHFPPKTSFFIAH